MNPQATEFQESYLKFDRNRRLGEVIWFSSSKGYGFIRPEEFKDREDKDLFVHFHYIVQRGFKTLRKGDLVEFSIGSNKNGTCAIEVKIKFPVEDIKKKDEQGENNLQSTKK